MHDVYICLVISFFDTQDNVRKFVSADENIYICPKILVNQEHSSLHNQVSSFLYNYTNVKSPETIYPSLILAKKNIKELDLVYNLHLPSDTKLTDNQFFLQTYNISIIDPYVRKAIQYI